jgi:hypothetical protein
MSSKINYELERKLNKMKFEHCVKSIMNILNPKNNKLKFQMNN